MGYMFWFTVVFVGLFMLRAVLVTWLFLFLLPEGDRCPNCDEATLRLQARGLNRVLPWFRTSWCYRCGWEGLLRESPIETPYRSDATHHFHQP